MIAGPGDFGIGMSTTGSMTGVFGLIQSGHRHFPFVTTRRSPSGARRPNDVSRSCVAPAYATKFGDGRGVAAGKFTDPANLQYVGPHEPEAEPAVDVLLVDVHRPSGNLLALHGETVGGFAHPGRAADRTSGVHTSVVPATTTPAAVPVREKAATTDSVTGARTATVAAAPFLTALEAAGMTDSLVAVDKRDSPLWDTGKAFPALVGRLHTTS